MNEIVNALKAPFVTLPQGEQPRPIVTAAVWMGIGLLISRI